MSHTYRVCFSNRRLDTTALHNGGDAFNPNPAVNVEYVGASSSEEACNIVRRDFPNVRSAVAFQCYNPI